MNPITFYYMEAVFIAQVFGFVTASMFWATELLREHAINVGEAILLVALAGALSLAHIYLYSHIHRKAGVY